MFQAVLSEAHENAVQKALTIFNATAVGAGSARLHYEKLLHNFFRKAFEVSIDFISLIFFIILNELLWLS